jgi:hypothetical protein
MPFQRSVVSGSIGALKSGSMKYVTELVQTNMIIQISINDIRDICFIFSLKDFSGGTAFCDGIVNAFLVRYRCSPSDGKWTGIDLDFYYCFPSMHYLHFYKTSYINTVWNGITEIQDELSLLLNIQRQYQSTFESCSATICIGTQLWSYLYDHLCSLATIKFVKLV